MWNVLFENIKLKKEIEEDAQLHDKTLCLLKIFIEEQEEKRKEDAKLHEDYSCDFVTSSKVKG